MSYLPLDITTLNIGGLRPALSAMRLPKPQTSDASFEDDLVLAAKLVKAGDDHAKFSRGIMVWYRLQCQVGWLIEYEQYEVGITRLSSSSSMHDELRKMTGRELAEKKQADLPTKIYTIIDCASYQALRRVYLARKNHRHPDWHIFCEWVKTIPFFDSLIVPEEVKI